MKDGTRINITSTIFFIAILCAIIFSEDCKGQELDTTYALIKVTVADPDKNGTADIVMLTFSNTGNGAISKILVYYAYDGTYMGRAELEGKIWVYYFPNGKTLELGKDKSLPPWIKGV